MIDGRDYPKGDQDSHKKHMRHLKALSAAKTRALKGKMHKKVKKEFGLSKENEEYGKKNFHA